jgi:hypothetical protein
MHDARLLGTWRSDASKTVREIASRRDMRLAKNKKLASLFGKLELRYTRNHCYARFENRKSVNTYKVVAKDEYSVVVVSVNPVAGKQIHHLHFEGSHYWIYLGSGGLREFFKRVKSSAGRAGTKRTSSS